MKLERPALKHLNFACILVSPHVSHLSKHKTTTHGFPNTPSGGGAGASSGAIRLHRAARPGRDSVAMRQSGLSIISGVRMSAVASHGRETTQRILYVTSSSAWNRPTCIVSEDCTYLVCSFARVLSRMGSHIYISTRSDSLVKGTNLFEVGATAQRKNIIRCIPFCQAYITSPDWSIIEMVQKIHNVAVAGVRPLSFNLPRRLL